MTDTPADTLNKLDQASWDGIQSLLDNYAQITEQDDVALAYTLDVREPATWVAMALKSRNISVTLIPMLPLRDPEFCRRLSTVIPPSRKTPGRYVLMVLERETVSHDEIIRHTFMSYDRNQYLVIRVLNASHYLFANGMAIKAEEHAARNATIFEYCRDASSLTITTAKGTELHVGLDPHKFRWLSMSALDYPGKTLVLPTGEIATFPATVCGRLVADFALQANFLIAADTRLNTSPVTLEIRDSEVTDYFCGRPDIMRILDKAFSYTNSRRVGELGFGTNSQVKVPSFENSLLNERCPGVHLGFGNHNQAIGDVGYACATHIDLIAMGGLVRAHASKKSIDLSNIPPSPNWQSLHLGSEHEDIFSPPLMDADCCGARF